MFNFSLDSDNVEKICKVLHQHRPQNVKAERKIYDHAKVIRVICPYLRLWGYYEHLKSTQNLAIIYRAVCDELNFVQGTYSVCFVSCVLCYVG